MVQEGQQHLASVMKMLTDEKRVVTTKYCSHRLHVNPNESKRILRNVYEEHKSDNKVVPVYAVYYQERSDEQGENEPAEKFGMKLVQGDGEEQFGENSEKELYALAPHVMEDVASVCFSTDSLCLRQLLNNDPHCLATISSSQLKNSCSKVPQATTQKSEKSVPSAQPSCKPVAMETATKPVEKKAPAPAKPAGIASLFGKQQTSSSSSSKKVEEAKAEKKSPVKEKKSAIKDEEDLPVTKKKNRKVIVEDDEDVVEDVEMKVSKEAEEEEKTEKQPETMAVDEEPEKETPPSSQPLEQGSGGGSGARRLVERTYVDDEGYFVTEKTWTHDNTAPAQKPSKPAAETKAPTKAPTKTTSKQAASNQAAKGKQQTSLTSFFKKV